MQGLGPAAGQAWQVGCCQHEPGNPQDGLDHEGPTIALLNAPF